VTPANATPASSPWQRRTNVKVTVDVDKCQGHARCAALAPEVFELDDLRNIATHPGDVRQGLEDQAMLGTGVCPERALWVE
jgi:ferredoxin